MKRLVFFLTLCLLMTCTFAQKKTTSVRGYYRKDGTYVNPHTRHYNAGSGSGSSGSSGSTYYTPDLINYDNEINGGSAHAKRVSNPLNKIGDIEVMPAKVVNDTTGIVLIVAVLRYNEVVVDICALARNFFTFSFDASAGLHFKIQANKFKPEHILELTSKYNFQLKDEHLLKSEYLGVANMQLPSYMTLSLESLMLR